MMSTAAADRALCSCILKAAPVRAGETMVECAEREMLEETGLRLRNVSAIGPRSQMTVEFSQVLRVAETTRMLYLCIRTGGGIISPTLDVPTPFAAADVIERDSGSSDRIAFHYAIVEVAARVENPSATPVPAGDVDDARWVPIDELESFPGLVDFLPGPNMLCWSRLHLIRGSPGCGVCLRKERHAHILLRTVRVCWLHLPQLCVSAYLARQMQTLRRLRLDMLLQSCPIAVT